MKIRTSENSHDFQTRLFNRLHAYSLQGLLMNDRHEFTTAIEAVEYEEGDDKTKVPFTQNELHARYVLAREAGVPLYLLCYMDKLYKLIKVKEINNQVVLHVDDQLDEMGFIQWWGERKQTVQRKHLNNGGEARLGETIFDTVLRRYGYEWGGNIDGFVLSGDNQHVAYIIDNISVSKKDLNDEPSHYFNSSNPKHGPRYEGWYASVKLANQIKVPHLLFTIDKRDKFKEHIGLTVIEKLSPEGIFYVDNQKPNYNVVEGMEVIVRAINEKLRTASPPALEEKTERSIRKIHENMSRRKE